MVQKLIIQCDWKLMADAGYRDQMTSMNVLHSISDNVMTATEAYTTLTATSMAVGLVFSPSYLPTSYVGIDMTTLVEMMSTTTTTTTTTLGTTTTTVAPTTTIPPSTTTWSCTTLMPSTLKTTTTPGLTTTTFAGIIQL